MSLRRRPIPRPSSYPSNPFINPFPSIASTNPSFAVVWHHGLSSISVVIASAKQLVHCLRGNASTTFAIAEREIRCGFRPTLSVWRKEVSVEIRGDGMGNGKWEMGRVTGMIRSAWVSVVQGDMSWDRMMHLAPDTAPSPCGICSQWRPPTTQPRAKTNIFQMHGMSRAAAKHRRSTIEAIDDGNNLMFARARREAVCAGLMW